MVQLSREETFLLLTCRPDLTPSDDVRLQRIVDSDLDWSFVLWRAESYQTLPLCGFHLNRLALLPRTPEWVVHYIHMWSQLSKARSEVQFRRLGELLGHFRACDLEHYLFKGPLLAALLYSDPALRPMQDLDIMVRKADVWRVQKELYRLGYQHGVFNPADGVFTHMFRKITHQTLEHKYALHSVTMVEEIRPKFDTTLIAPEWRTRQIKSFVQDDGSVRMPVFVDIHFSLGAGMEEVDVWRGAGPRRLLGREVHCQSLTSVLWFSAARIYFEAYQHGTLKLQMLGDIDALLRLHAEDIDWPELLAVAGKYGFSAAIFYVLEQVRRLFDAPVPLKVLALLMPDQQGRPDEADFGDIVPKLLSRTVISDLQLA
ncbi:hypothetical protein ELI13_34445 [Rhizobium ruizarguesonis]|uniref:Nucleotidyltransferase family protein n=3 Tax=Rhizobium TaxID=379 RepID=A0A1B8R979_RHILT|nr:MULTISPECIES: nucleotidyltransferase family protein [Rhizobium]AOO91808.1 hypothetical protein [Rhizobium leguminosarum bv. trifolii]MDI5930231.1 nucleotidyltransferase family protein [Rhizobium leguminosarum]NDK52132.1 nucleotidyltransferase family protein [Rhizobium laguerreae]OBY05406.1 hypothetical protein BAE36_20325 [Rhizobium leguminosarum bv. trifolii]TAU13332.1 hypothetical protein ELI50_36005 [Rhizobium leguminosarum]